MSDIELILFVATAVTSLVDCVANVSLAIVDLKDLGIASEICFSDCSVFCLERLLVIMGPLVELLFLFLLIRNLTVVFFDLGVVFAFPFKLLLVESSLTDEPVNPRSSKSLISVKLSQFSESLELEICDSDIWVLFLSYLRERSVLHFSLLA